MISSSGFVSSARPIASICCSPPESCVALTFLRSASRGNNSYTAAEVHVPDRDGLIILRCSSVVNDWKSRRPCGTYAMPVPAIL